MKESSRRHPWSWLRWVLVSLFVVAWIPSAFNVRLAWIWIGYAGVLTTALGLTGTLAPDRLLWFRRTYIPRAPQWEQRLMARFQRKELSLRAVRLSGVLVLLLGLYQLSVVVWVLGHD